MLYPLITIGVSPGNSFLLCSLQVGSQSLSANAFGFCWHEYPISLSLSLCAVKDSASHTCKQTYYSVAFPFLVRDCFCHSLRISSSFIIVGSLWCSRPSICFRTSCGEICAVHFLPAVCFFPVRKRVSLPFFLWALRSFALLFE